MSVLVIVLASVAGWLSLGWRLARSVASRYLVRADAKDKRLYPSLYGSTPNDMNRDEAIMLGWLTFLIPVAGLVYLAYTGGGTTGSALLRNWLPAEHLRLLQEENERLRKEMRLSE